MIIEKNGTIYRVKETASAWVLKMTVDGLDVTYNVSKADCPSFEALTEFVTKSNAI